MSSIVPRPPVRTASGKFACALALTSMLAAACGGGIDGETADGADARPTAAAPTGPPIKIGFVNMEGGGALSFPEVTKAAQAAAEDINSAGGIDGRPMELVTCAADGTPDASLACANKFVQGKVAAVVDGVDYGGDAKLPALKAAGIPLFGITTFGQNAAADPAAVTTTGAGIGPSLSAQFKVLADQGSKNVIFLSPEFPGVKQAFTGLIQPVGKKLNVEASLATYSPGAPDFTTAVAAAKKQNADGIIMGGSDADCTALIRTARSTGYTGGIVVSSCSEFLELGQPAVGTYTLQYLWLPLAEEFAPPSKKSELEEYNAAMERAGLTDSANGIAAYGYAAVRNMGKVLELAEGEIEPKAVAAVLAGLAGFDSFLGQQVDCGSRAKSTSSCGTGLLAYEVTDDLKYKPVGGDYVIPEA